MVKSVFWGHISHYLGVCLYSEVVLDFRFGHWKCPNREGGKGHFSKWNDRAHITWWLGSGCYVRCSLSLLRWEQFTECTRVSSSQIALQSHRNYYLQSCNPSSCHLFQRTAQLGWNSNPLEPELVGLFGQCLPPPTRVLPWNTHLLYVDKVTLWPSSRICISKRNLAKTSKRPVKWA